MLSFQLSIVIVIIAFIIGVLIILDKRLKEYNDVVKKQLKKEMKKEKIKEPIFDPVKRYDEDKLNDPFEAPAKRPERTQMGYAPIMKTSNNPLQPFPTRGYPDNYHQLGTLILIEDENEEGYNKIEQDNKLITLFGRQKYPGSSEYEYYTSLSTGNTTTKIPLKTQQRELFDNDEVFVKEINKKYRVNLYPNEELKYNPFLF